MTARLSWTEPRRRLAAALPAILQTSVAASAAWLLATEAVGHTRPFFAPVAAIITLGVVLTARVRRALEIALGVVLGVLVADLIVIQLGPGPAQIALVTALAMIVAVLAGGGRILIGQAATSAVLVATINVPDHVSLSRPVDALVGGATALTIGLLILPLDPLKAVRRAADALADDLAAALETIAAALRARDHDGAIDALTTARAGVALVATYAEATVAGAELCRYAPLRRRARPVLARHRVAALQLGFAAGNVRVIARGVIRAVTLDAHVPELELEALDELVAGLRTVIADVDAGDADGATARHAIRAAALATLALERTANLSVSALTGQLRFVATDLLRALGIDDERSSVAVRGAAAAAG